MKNHSKITMFVLMTALAVVSGAGFYHGCSVDKYEAKVSTYSLTPNNALIGFGSAKQFTASAVYSDGTTTPRDSSGLTWTSSDSSVATMSTITPGLATAGTTTGVTSITATDSNGVSGSTILNVGQVKSSAPVSISITPANPSVLIGRPVQFNALGAYADGSTQDVSSMVTWTSSDTTQVTIDATTGLANVKSSATPAATVTITATVTGTSVSGTTTITVKAQTAGH